MLIEEIKKYLESLLNGKSKYKHGSHNWTNAKWLSIILNKFAIPKGEFRNYKSKIVKEVNKIKSLK